MRACTWTRRCDQPGLHDLECQTRPGLIILVTACDEHLAVAELWGYRRRRGTDTDIARTSTPSDVRPWGHRSQ